MAEAINYELIKRWLIKEVADALQKPEMDIDVELPLSSYGLDSVHAVGLVGDLEAWLDVSIDPTFAWDYPTIHDMAQFLESYYADTHREEADAPALGV